MPDSKAAAQLEIHAKQELDHALIISRQIDYLGKIPAAVTPKPVRTSKDSSRFTRSSLAKPAGVDEYARLPKLHFVS